MSLPFPKHSLSLPTTKSSSNEQVLPTPSSSTTVRQAKQQIIRQELEQQLTEKKKQLEESSSGIGRNVLSRQVNQLEESIKELDNQRHGTLDESLLSAERLRNLERDLADYRKPPGMRNKKEVCN
jgi:predicted  nucleic acid-binding Zn-ribbon protein